MVWSLPRIIRNENMDIFLEIKQPNSDRIISTNTVRIRDIEFDDSFEVVDLIDQHPEIIVTDRTINMPTDYVLAVQNDNDSQILTFLMDREYDGVDRLLKTILINYWNADGEKGSSYVTNVSSVDDKIRIGWVIGNGVSKSSGTIRFNIQIMDSDDYNWKTLTASFDVDETIIGEYPDIEDQYPELIEEILNAITNIKNDLTTKQPIATGITNANKNVITNSEGKISFADFETGGTGDVVPSSLISADANNTLTVGADLKLFVEEVIVPDVVPSSLVSTDTNNALTIGSDSKLFIEESGPSDVVISSLVSTDTDNALIIGSDSKLFVKEFDIPDTIASSVNNVMAVNNNISLDTDNIPATSTNAYVTESLLERIDDIESSVGTTVGFPMFFVSDGLSLIAPINETAQVIASKFESNVALNTFVEIATFTANNTIPNMNFKILQNGEFNATVAFRSNLNYNNAQVILEILADDVVIGNSKRVLNIRGLPNVYSILSFKGVYNQNLEFDLAKSLKIRLTMAQLEFGAQNIDIYVMTSSLLQSMLILNSDAVTLTGDNIRIGDQSLTEVLDVVDSNLTIMVDNIDTITSDIVNINTNMATIEAIAKGAAQALVFDTLVQLENWINGLYIRSDGKTISDLRIGDWLLIIELDVPDFWWDGTQKQELETGKIDLSDYATIVQLDAVRTTLNTHTADTNIHTSVAEKKAISDAFDAIGADILAIETATIEVGTVTSGANANVTNVGTPTSAVFDFVLPRGEKGDTGDQGIQGIQGTTGATGATGQAATIAVGTITTGAEGTNAAITNSGTSSAAVFNFTIPRGNTGAAGATGAAGTVGADGKSAFASAQSGGYTGTESAFYSDLAAVGGLADAILAIVGGA